MKREIIHHIRSEKAKGAKQLAILIDPDKSSKDSLSRLAKKAEKIGASYFLVGGSLLTDGDLNNTIKTLKGYSSIPLLIFPGSSSQINESADGILFLSLLSSRNPEMLIGQQVVAAPYLRKTDLEVISTAYLLIESGRQTTASYMSNSNPIPSDKAEIAASTALAGEYLGMDLIYLDGGSGALHAIPEKLISKVSSYTSRPLFVGGGINSFDKAKKAFEAGADVIVIGNAFEAEEDFSEQLAEYLAKNS